MRSGSCTFEVSGIGCCQRQDSRLVLQFVCSYLGHLIMLQWIWIEDAVYGRSSISVAWIRWRITAWSSNRSASNLPVWGRKDHLYPFRPPLLRPPPEYLFFFSSPFHGGPFLPSLTLDRHCVGITEGIICPVASLLLTMMHKVENIAWHSELSLSSVLTVVGKKNIILLVNWQICNGIYWDYLVTYSTVMPFFKQSLFKVDLHFRYFLTVTRNLDSLGNLQNIDYLTDTARIFLVCNVGIKE